MITTRLNQIQGVYIYWAKLSPTISNPDYYVYTQTSKLALKALHGLACRFSDRSNAMSGSSSSLVSATDGEQVHQQLQAHFGGLADPRGKQGVLHPLVSIVMIALLATIGGATGWEEIEV